MCKLNSLVFLLLLLVWGCASLRTSTRREIETLQNISRLELYGNYDKAVCDQRSGVIFVQNKSTHEVQIFHHNQRINTLGGLGFERTNFQRLNDIGVDADGNLLVLDSMQKLLRKYSPEGMVIAELKLSELQQPELFCQSGDGALFVFDAATQEIVCYSPFDAAELYRFGRFQLEQPVSIACSRDYLYAYSRLRNCTYVFYILGQYKETLPGQVVFDNFNNPIPAERLFLPDTASTPVLITLNRETICALYDRHLQLFRIRYVRGNDATQ